jgi:hypothetical protein
MYYRVAIRVDASSTWRWKSTALSELSVVFQWLRFYHALPQDRLRVFSACSREGMNEQLVRVNQGLESTSVTAAQFLKERMIGSSAVAWGTTAHRTQGNERMTSIAVVTEPQQGESDRKAWPLAERGVSFLEQRRAELERGAGGDHDLPYRFILPISMPQVLAWVKLLRRVRHGDLQPEIVAFAVGSGTSDARVVSRFAMRVSKQQEVKLP